MLDPSGSGFGSPRLSGSVLVPGGFSVALLVLHVWTSLVSDPLRLWVAARGTASTRSTTQERPGSGIPPIRKRSEPGQFNRVPPGESEVLLC